MLIKNDQYKYEITAWLRTLDYLQQENIYMKNRIAEVIKTNISADALERIEYYQSFFLNKDTVIAFLRQDIKKLEAEDLPDEELHRWKKLLRNDMEKMEREISHLKSDFNNYMETIS